MVSSLLTKRTMSTLNRVTGLTPLILIDFDQTITIKDTIGLLGQFGVNQTNCPKPWSYFVDSYLEDYRGYQAHLPDLPKDSNFKAFTKRLDGFKPVEEASLSRVSKHKVFKGIARQKFIVEGKMHKTILQPNVIDALQNYKENIRIVSLNWSKDWILGFMDQLGLSRNHIYSNDLTFENDICTGEIVPRILTASDKQTLIKDHIKTADQKIVYIGDSLGDIEALVAADMGIIMGNDSSLLEPLAKYGYKVQEDLTQANALYRVNDWNQISRLLETHFFPPSQ